MLPAVSELLDLFSTVEGTERLELLAGFGDRLPALPPPYAQMRDAGLHMIHECQSPVFFLVEVIEDTVRLRADVAREAAIARGFTGLLCDTFDSLPVEEVSQAPPDLLDALGLTELLTMQRRRGLAAIYGRLFAATFGPLG